jgi:hypothetical protein
MKGTGIIAIEMNPNTELPHPYPKLAYNFGPAMGKMAAMTERSTVFAAMADAAYLVKTSMR